MSTRFGRARRRAVWLAVPAVGSVLIAQADDYSLENGSPEVPFTFAAGDIAVQDGSAVNIAGALLGLGPSDELDAFSYGDDQVEPAGIENLVNFDFSVDRLSTGNGGTVSTEANGNGAAGDKFRILAFRNGRTVGPQRFSDAPNHGLTAKSSGTTESEIDALGLVSGTQLPAFLSVSRAGSTTLTTLGPADIAYVQQPGVTAATVYATAAQLGLQAGDNVDALCIRDGGALGQLDALDLVYVSLDRASPTRAATFANGADGVIRVWPLPARVIYTSTQLDLAPGDELDAMTARDPGPRAGGHSFLPRDSFVSLCGDRRALRNPALLYTDAPPDLTIRAGTLRVLGKKRKTLCFESRGSQRAGFRSVRNIAKSRVVLRYRTSIKKRIGLQNAIWGSEIDKDFEPGVIPTEYVFLGCTAPGSDMGAFVNVNGVNVGTPQVFPGASELECQIVIDAALGLDCSCREPGGTWTSLYNDPTYTSDSTLSCGFGVSRCDAGAQIQFADTDCGGDLYEDVQPYLYRIDECSAALNDADGQYEAYEESAEDDEERKLQERELALLQLAQDILVGRPGIPKGSKPTTYPDGLLQQLRDETLGALPERVSGNAVLARLGKTLRATQKARGLGDRDGPNVKKVRRQIAAALASLDDARDLLCFGLRLKR